MDVGLVTGARVISDPREPKNYQEDLVRPGILPASASSRSVRRDTPKRRWKPRGRPLSEQRLRMRTLEEFFGSFCSFFWAAVELVVRGGGVGEDGLQLGALGGVLFGEALALLVAFDGGCFRHGAELV